MKYLLFLLSLLFVACDNQRIANVTTPQEMLEKDFIYIFPSVPKEHCFADKLTSDFNDIILEFNGSNPEVSIVDHPVTCATYGIDECSEDIIEDEFTLLRIITCISEEKQKVCINVFGEEYQDSQGVYFEETCLLGVDIL